MLGIVFLRYGKDEFVSAMFDIIIVCKTCFICLLKCLHPCFYCNVRSHYQCTVWVLVIDLSMQCLVLVCPCNFYGEFVYDMSRISLSMQCLVLVSL